MLKDRNDSAGKGKREKVVARELCSVLSSGTRTYCHLDDLSLLEDNAPSVGGGVDGDDKRSVGGSKSRSVLMCIKESMTSDIDISTTTTTSSSSPNGLSEYGICCVDTVLGTITIAQFGDNKQRSRLRTMLARYRPSEILLEKGQSSAYTTGINNDYDDDGGGNQMYADGSYYGGSLQYPCCDFITIRAIITSSLLQLLGSIQLILPGVPIDYLHPGEFVYSIIVMMMVSYMVF